LLVTVLEVIQRSTEFLKNKGVDSPRLQTELLLAHLLNMPRMKLYLNFERKLSATEVDNFRELIKRRGQREPLQHIVGSTCFCGLELAVDRQVLIPRPETELLAEQGWTFLNSLKTQHSPLSTLDLGTGSGCLAIVLAVHCPMARVFAIDISAEALNLARQNAARHNVRDRIDFDEVFQAEKECLQNLPGAAGIQIAYSFNGSCDLYSDPLRLKTILTNIPCEYIFTYNSYPETTRSRFYSHF